MFFAERLWKRKTVGKPVRCGDQYCGYHMRRRDHVCRIKLFSCLHALFSFSITVMETFCRANANLLNRHEFVFIL